MDEKVTNSKKDNGQEPRTILLLHYGQGMSYEQIGEKLCLSTAEVSLCCAKFAKNFSSEKSLMEVINALKDQEPNQDGKLSSEQEIRILRRKLRDAEIKAEAYEEMVDIAEKTFNIPIRKKFGAKQ